MSHDLIVQFKYDARQLAPESSERNPELIIWASCSKDWYIRVPVQWDDKDKFFSKTQTITVPISDSTALAYDDAIHVCVLAETPNHMNKLCKIKAGTAAFYLQELMQEGHSPPVTQPLIMPTVRMESGGFLEKGAMTMIIVNPPTRIAYLPPTTFAPIQKNQSYLEGIIDGMGRKLMCMVDSNIARESGAKHSMGPSDSTCEGLHAPYYVSESGYLAGDMYFVNYTATEPEEPFMKNLLEVNLTRQRMTREQIEKSVDQQFNEKGSKLNENFAKTCVFMATMLCSLSWKLPYVSDVTHTGRRGDLGKKKISKKASNGPEHRVSIEYFNDAIMDRGGDCEDLGQAIHRVYAMLKYGKPSLKNPSVHSERHGSWQDPTLKSLQRVCYLYMGMGSLGTVTARFLGEKAAKGELPDIGSTEDMRAEVGGHLWAEMHPLVNVERMISGTNPSHPFKMYPGLEHHAWETKLPSLILEGTGQLHPLQLPASAYEHESAAHAECAISCQKKSIAVLRMASDTEVLKMSRTTRVQSALKDDKNRRISSFYRATNHSMTDEMLREGYSFSGFTWVYNAKGKPLVYGANMHHKLLNDPTVQLVMHPEVTKDETAYTKSVFRHSMPLAMPVYVPSSAQRIKASCQSEIGEFVKNFTSLPFSSKSEDIFYYNFHFDTSDFVKPEFREKLAKDIKSLKHLSSVNVDVEVLTEEVYDVRIELGFSLSSDDVTAILSNKPKGGASTLIGCASFSQFMNVSGRDSDSENDEEDYEDMEMERELRERVAYGKAHYDFFVVVRWEGQNQLDYRYETYEFDTFSEMYGFEKGINTSSEREPQGLNSAAREGWERAKQAWRNEYRTPVSVFTCGVGEDC